MSDGSWRVLVVEDDDALRDTLALRLEAWGYDVSQASTGDEALRRIEADDPDLLLMDVVLPGRSGLELLERMADSGRDAKIIVMTAHGSVDWAVEAMKQGASDFLTKPIDHDHLETILHEARADMEVARETRRLERRLDEQPGIGRLIGASPRMRDVFEQVRLLASNDASAIIAGESGVGKEVVARSIHELSTRREGPFVAINAAAIPEGLIESEIFGHEKGAFTGAIGSRAGCFEQADGGTFFLDEIGEMPIDLQPKLLRIIEEKRTRRLGGSREIPFDTRVLAATNRNLEGLVGEGRLREDLWYRLNVFTLVVPPLRERPEDIPLIAQHFVREFNSKHGLEVDGLGVGARDHLMAYSFHGNVRELRNVIERAGILAREGRIEPAHLPAFVRVQPETERELVIPIGVTAAEAEKRLILETLGAVGGNKAEAARKLDLDPKTIRNKLKRYEGEEAG